MFRSASLLALAAALAVAGCSGSSAGAGGCAEGFDTAAWERAGRAGDDADRRSLAREVIRCRHVKVGHSGRQVRQVSGSRTSRVFIAPD